MQAALAHEQQIASGAVSVASDAKEERKRGGCC